MRHTLAALIAISVGAPALMRPCWQSAVGMHAVAGYRVLD